MRKSSHAKNESDLILRFVFALNEIAQFYKCFGKNSFGKIVNKIIINGSIVQMSFIS